MGALHDGGVVFHDGHGQLRELGIDELAFGGRVQVPRVLAGDGLDEVVGRGVQAAKGGEDERLKDGVPALHDVLVFGVLVSGSEVAGLAMRFLVGLEMGGA